MRADLEDLMRKDLLRPAGGGEEDASLGKMPTTFVRRLISAFKRSRRFLL